MAQFGISEFERQKPVIQMAPLIDMIFITLIFFMVLSVLSQMETEINISVPKAKEAKEASRTPGEIIINVSKDGSVLVNQQALNYEQLKQMLLKVSNLFPDQAVIIRADQNTFHKNVIKVLDACASADIWNIAFATVKE